MKYILVTAITIFAAGVMPTVAMAYSETPFVNAKVGETKTCTAWLAKRGDDANTFLVVVQIGCKGGHIVFYATAAADVVSKDQVGKPVVLTAKVIHKSKRASNWPHIQLEILHLERIEKKKK